MPAQHPLRQPARGEQAQDALDVGDGRAFLLVLGVRASHAGEEAGRRQLALVAHDHHLPAARYGPERVHRLDLAGLVHDQQVERHAARREELRDG